MPPPWKDKTVCLIAAIDEAGALGRDGSMPWRLPADLKHFKQVTLGHPVIMGRRTFASIGRALPGRQNIVVSRNPDWKAPGAERAGDLEAAFRVARGRRVFVIGGGEIYALAMAWCDELLLTEVHTRVDGADTFFPAFDPSDWRTLSRVDRRADEQNPHDLSFVHYRRLPGG